MNTKQLLVVICGAAAISMLSACQSQAEAFDSYTVGFSTPARNQIWVQDASFDGKWGVPAGSMACCWEEAGPTAIVFDKPMPHSVHIQWLQEERKLVYTANVQLPDDLGDRARKLPGYTVISTGRRFKDDPILMIGMKPDGQVTIWLSNVGGAANVKGRVLDVVGRAQAESRPWPGQTLDANSED